MDDGRQRESMRERIRELLAITGSITDQVEISSDDDFALMALCYLSKQVDHARAILLLGDSPDTVLIVRAMLEGLVQLKWAAQEPAARAKKWRDFASVHNWRALRALMAQGEMVDSSVAHQIRQALEATGEAFLKRTRPLPVVSDAQQGDPFHPSWVCMKTDQIFKAVDGEALYAIYKSFSDWQHWSIGGIGRSLVPSANGIDYTAHENGWDLAALALTFQCLFETAELVKNHLGIGHDQQLQRERDNFRRTRS